VTNGRVVPFKPIIARRSTLTTKVDSRKGTTEIVWGNTARGIEVRERSGGYNDHLHLPVVERSYRTRKKGLKEKM